MYAILTTFGEIRTRRQHRSAALLCCSGTMNVVIFVQVAALLVGPVLIGWSVLLYESEERQIDDILAGWWIEIDDLAKKAASKNVAMLRIAGRAVTTWLSTLFGEELLSIRAVSASITLSVSSLFLFLSASGMTAATHDEVLDTWSVAVFMLVLGGCLFYLAVSTKLDRWRRAVAVGVFWFLAIFELVGLYQSDWLPFQVISVPVGFTLGVASDFLIIVVVRSVARNTATASNASMAIVGIAVNTVLGVLLSALPLGWLTYWASADSLWRLTAGVAAATNVYASVIALATAILLVTVVVQRAIWSLIQRPLYALWRFKVFQNRKLLFYAGSALLVFAMPGAQAIVESATRWLR